MIGSFRFVFPALLALIAIGGASLPLPARAADAPSAKAEAAQKDPAGKFVQNLGDQALRIMANKQLTPDQRADEFSKMLSDSFDLKTIGRYVIGRAWNGATPEQQQEYMDLFKGLVLKTYGGRMNLYTGEGFVVVGTRADSDIDTTVTSNITHPDGSKPTVIDWRIRTKDGKMGVIDVSVENISLSLTQRQEYASVIQRNGGDISGLLKQMRDELNSLSAPAK